MDLLKHILAALNRHRRCEAVEDVFQIQMAHLRERIETLEEELREQRHSFDGERRELMDKLLTYANPNATAYIERMQRGLIPNIVATPGGIGIAVPTSQPEPDPRARQFKESVRPTDPTPRRPILTPESAKFRPLNRPQVVQGIGSDINKPPLDVQLNQKSNDTTPGVDS